MSTSYEGLKVDSIHPKTFLIRLNKISDWIDFYVV